MVEKTYIKGKDRDLESSIQSMQQQLQDLGFDVEQASWLNPVDNVYSVHIRDRDCGLMFTNGKGASRKACLASALGEYFERLSCNYFFADFYLGQGIADSDFVHYPDERWFETDGDTIPEGLLDQGLWRFYDPEQQLTADHLLDFNSGLGGERGICAVPLTRVRDDRPVWFPVNVIGNLYVSNGMSAGNTANEARVQGLSEVFERYVKNRIIAEAICLPQVPDSVLQRYPSILASIRALESHGYHLRICDASLGGQFPVMNVTLLNPEDGSVFASFGAHPSFEVALERTVTELLQGRSLDQLKGFQTPSFDLDEVADHHNLETHFIDSSGLIAFDFFGEQADYEFVDWDHDESTGQEFEYLRDIIHRLGFDIYIADYQHLWVYACRILVPGMSEIYPVDDLYWDNNNEGALYRESLLSLQQLSQQACREVYENLEQGGYSDYQRVAEFIGVAPDPGSVWAGLRIGELKAMLCLATEDYELALEWIEWCLSMGQLNDSRRRHYLCLQALIHIQVRAEYRLKNYLPHLEKLYGKEELQVGLDIIDGKRSFHGLHSPGLGLAGFETHLRLLQGYEKLQRAKLAGPGK